MRPKSSHYASPEKALFLIDRGAESLGPAVHRVETRMPQMMGEPIRIQRHPGLADRFGPVHAGAFLRERRIAFNCTRAEFPRIFVHEAFHFVWLRLGNARRLDFERLLDSEIARGVAGELGWAAECRKTTVTLADRRARARLWREYCCESFCETAAWLYSGASRHPEFTLAKSDRVLRRRWFEEHLSGREIPV